MPPAAEIGVEEQTTHECNVCRANRPGRRPLRGRNSFGGEEAGTGRLVRWSVVKSDSACSHARSLSATDPERFAIRASSPADNVEERAVGRSRSVPISG
jgi:hypothetical protein